MENLTYDISDQIAILKINRPQVRNALNQATLKEMLHFLEKIALEKQLKVIILTGSGDKAFIAGADIKEMAGLTPTQMLQFSALGQNVANVLETAPFVTIAAVNGYTFGGGLEMALACDFIYASRTAQMGLPEVTLGLIPGFGGTQRLSDAVGSRVAKELMMTGKSLTAEEAKNIGIVNRICEPQNLITECLETAKSILKHSFSAVLGVKNAVNGGMQLGVLSALELEKNICAACFDTIERNNAMKAFLERK